MESKEKHNQKEGLIPHVDKLDYYMAIDDWAMVQLVGHGDRKKAKNPLSKSQLSIIQSNMDFCALLTEICFSIDSYGLINYFTGYNDKDSVRFHNLLSGLKIRNQVESAKFLEDGLKFNELYIKEIEYLNTDPDDFEEKYEALDSILNIESSLFPALKNIATDIKKQPNNYCVDRDGEPIVLLFSGVTKKYYSNGDIYKEYNIVDGKAHGECIDYIRNNVKERITIYENGKEKYDSKRWNRFGVLVYEKSDIYEKWYFANGEISAFVDFENNMRGAFYENGQKKYETKNYPNENITITKKWNADGTPITDK